jgi:flagellar FliL protein
MMKTIAIFVAMVFLMAGAAYVVVSVFLAPADTTTQAEEAEPVEEHGGEAEVETGGGEIFMIEELLVNPTGTSGTRYLSASLGLEVADQATAVRLEEKKLQIRDLLNGILSSRTVDELTTASERERMRLEITERLNQLIAPDKLTAVYFVDYVLQ